MVLPKTADYPPSILLDQVILTKMVIQTALFIGALSERIKGYYTTM